MPSSGPVPRDVARRIAEESLAAIEHGFYTIPESDPDTSYDLATTVNLMNSRTAFYAADSTLSTWASAAEQYSTAEATSISIVQTSAIEGTRTLVAELNGSRRVGVLNFASAKNPGGGFLGGARAQEETLARSSTLYRSLMTPTAQKFYTSHKANPKAGFYSHAMVFSPHVVFFRADDGTWIAPFEVDVLTSPAVNAGRARMTIHDVPPPADVEEKIEAVMRERMARLLFLFFRRGIKDIVLGSFGTGAFRNDVAMVAKIWADLLTNEGAPFKTAFSRVVFAIIDAKTFNTFKETFEAQNK
ncbi:hypothetical protein HWV62_31895 [Athelia sp. TMB]|nr:hypothetical protein HWV62_31895 [Athelia sp. TMB]